jgi:hypothetical protein
MLQVQEVENNLDVPKDAPEEPCEVNYLCPFSVSFWIIKFFTHNYNAGFIKSLVIIFIIHLSSLFLKSGDYRG